VRTSANHHPGIRVSDIERSARFYVEAFGGRRLTAPMLAEGPLAELTMGISGVRFSVCHIAFDDGTIELFQFHEPRHPVPRGSPAELGIIHICFQVDDVDAALERVERAGGGRFWDEVREIPRYGFRVIYATDPDGHVLELIDIPVQELAAAMWDSSREARAQREAAG
jgi:catechol 2,3-dioxygenase-like lactoylglutathione lyase family enzyme